MKPAGRFQDIYPRVARSLVVVVVLVLIVAALPVVTRSSVVLADDASLGRDADGVYPMKDAELEMVAEEVTIRLLPAEGPDGAAGLRAAVTCEFTFRNSSDTARDVLMGFPAQYRPEIVADAVGGDPLVHEFTVRIDGTEVPADLEPASPVAGDEGSLFASWYTFGVTFAPGQTRSVVNTYTLKNLHNSIGQAYLRYVLTTGRYWKGPIGKAVVRVELGEVGPHQLENLYPNTWRFSPDGRTLTWSRENFEPSYDLEIRYNIFHWTEGYLSAIDAGAREELLALRAEWEDLVGRALGLDQAQVQALYAEAVKEDRTVLGAYLRSLLPEPPPHPPDITGLEVVPGPEPSLARVRVAYADPAGDLVGLSLIVTQEGAIVADADLTETGRWEYQQSYSGVFEDCLIVAQPGRSYRIRAKVWDSEDRECVREVVLVAPSSSGAGPVPPDRPLTGGPQVTALWLAGLLLIIGALTVTAAVLARRGRGNRPRAKANEQDRFLTRGASCRCGFHGEGEG